MAAETGPGAPVLGAMAVVLDADKVLLTKREDFEVWCLPGGHVDPGESLATAAVREVKEETGFDVELEHFVGIYSRLGGDKTIHLATFLARPVGGLPTPQPDEVLDMRYFAPDSLPEALFWWHRRPIADALAGVCGAVYSVTIDPPAVVGSRRELYALRDSMGLSRRGFYHWYFEDRPGNSIRRET